MPVSDSHARISVLEPNVAPVKIRFPCKESAVSLGEQDHA
jgi:hypothetical protein